MNKTPALLSVVLLFAAACSSPPYTPKGDLPFEPIPEFKTKHTIELENAQPSVTPVEIGDGWRANYNAWTGVAIEIATRELDKRGARFGPGSERRLKLSVTRAHYEAGVAEIELRVETGDGHRAIYTGKNTPADEDRPIDGAVMRAVVQLLKDPQVVNHLVN